ncbi:hypothetical protein DCC62_08815 [candidate division KSB1 bacterium]|nr:MAG: hypothetical protein DCC62_08815 [candidate division KSB1 bacterium]
MKDEHLGVGAVFRNCNSLLQNNLVSFEPFAFLIVIGVAPVAMDKKDERTLTFGFMDPGD